MVSAFGVTLSGAVEVLQPFLRGLHCSCLQGECVSRRMLLAGTSRKPERLHYLRVNVKFTVEQGTKAQRWCRGIAHYSFFKLGARWRWVVNDTPQSLYPQERDKVPIV
jgi:hypothetical protein